MQKFVRLVVVAMTIASMALAGVLVQSGSSATGGPEVYAYGLSGAGGEGRLYLQGNNNDNGDDNGNGNNNGNSNDNNDDDDDDDNGNGNRNSNDNRDDNGNGNGNDNDKRGDKRGAIVGGAITPTSAGAISRCFDVGQVGVLTLLTEGGSVTLDNVPPAFPAISNVTLAPVDPTTVPVAPGPVLDRFVFSVRSQQGCDGADLGALPSDVNLGIAYGIAADKSKLRIVRQEGATWVDVITVPDPDPAKPYISATIRQTGVYAIYQAP